MVRDLEIASSINQSHGPTNTKKKKKVNQREGKKKLPGAGEIVEPTGAREDDNTNLSIAENRKLLSFLQQTIPSLGERNLTTRRVIDPLNRDLSPSHFNCCFLISPRNIIVKFKIISRIQKIEQYNYLIQKSKDKIRSRETRSDLPRTGGDKETVQFRDLVFVDRKRKGKRKRKRKRKSRESHIRKEHMTIWDI